MGADIIASMLIAQIILLVVAIYCSIGFVLAVCFVLFGASRVDPAARHASWGFRLLILPGSAALWPMVLTWWVRAHERTNKK